MFSNTAFGNTKLEHHRKGEQQNGRLLGSHDCETKSETFAPLTPSLEFKSEPYEKWSRD